MIPDIKILTAITCLLLSIPLSNGLKLGAENMPQTCGKNLERIMNQPKQVNEYDLAKGNSSVYVDPLFSADKGSLYWDEHHGVDKELIKIYSDKVTGWSRPFDLIHRYQKTDQSLPLLWGKYGVQAVDPGSQGSLNDGWFLGAAASLAEHPKYIRRLFAAQEYIKAGVFDINLFLNGRPRQIIIDDRIALLKDDIPVNAGPSQASGWWLPLLEKAYAKTNVNYENMDYGDGQSQMEALRALSGVPVKQLDVKDPSFLTTLKEYYMNSYALNIFIPATGKNTFGLKPGKSYNIVDLIEVQFQKTGKSKITAIKLRDPWTNGGEISYTGPKFDKYGLTKNDHKNKTFFMSSESFIESFDYVNVAMLSDDWIVSQKKFDKSTDEFYRMVIKNNKTQDAFITIDYPTARMYAPDCPKQDVEYFAEVLSSESGQIIARQVIDPKISYGLIELPNLPRGDYELNVTMTGDGNLATGFIVTLYTKEQKMLFEDDYLVLSTELLKAEERNDTKLYQSLAQDGTVVINAYKDQKTNKITVEVIKKQKKDYDVTIQVETSEGLPLKTKSNTDWKNGLVAQNATITVADGTESYYSMKMLCPQKDMKCIYVIPQAIKLVGVLIDNDVGISTL